MIAVGAFALGVLAMLAGVAVAGWKLGARTGTRTEAEHRVDAVEEAFERGRQVGGNELGAALAQAAFDAPDAFDAWPAVAREGRPS